MLSGHVPGEPFSLSSLLAPGRARCLPLPQTAGTCGRCGRLVPNHRWSAHNGPDTVLCVCILHLILTTTSQKSPVKAG